MPETFPAVFIMGILLTLGSVLGLLAEKVNLPRIVIYIFVGVLFSPDLLGGTFHFSTAEWAPVLTDVALGVIAYIIGSEINLQNIKKEEKTVFAAVIGQSAGVLLFVGMGLWGLSMAINSVHQISLYQALVFGAVATATAPAATLGIIEEYKARGKVTNTLLAVIAVDDAIGVIFFTVLLGMGAGGSFSDSFLEGMRETGGALLLGGVLGLILGFIGSKLRKEELRLVTILGFIFLTYGLATMFSLSMLLSCMTLGFVSILIYRQKKAEWLLPLKHIEELVFLFFFTLAGIKFELHILFSSMLLVLVYVILRVAGKYSGTYLGLLASGADRKSKKLLGLCLFPQAGVAIGLAIRASHQPGFEETGAFLLNIILGSTIVFELTTPFLTRYALKKAGEIKEGPGGSP